MKKIVFFHILNLVYPLNLLIRQTISKNRLIFWTSIFNIFSYISCRVWAQYSYHKYEYLHSSNHVLRQHIRQIEPAKLIHYILQYCIVFKWWKYSNSTTYSTHTWERTQRQVKMLTNWTVSIVDTPVYVTNWRWTLEDEIWIE